MLATAKWLSLILYILVVIYMATVPSSTTEWYGSYYDIGKYYIYSYAVVVGTLSVTFIFTAVYKIR